MEEVGLTICNDYGLRGHSQSSGLRSSASSFRQNSGDVLPVDGLFSGGKVVGISVESLQVFHPFLRLRPGPKLLKPKNA